MRRTALAALACAVLTAATLATPARAAGPAPRGLLTGLTDGDAFESASAPDRAIAYQHAHAAGASIIRLTFAWANIEPVAPPDDASARYPGWSGYHWQLVDELVREVRAAGFQPLIEVGRAPAWAEGPGRPNYAPAGTWRPSGAAFEQLAAAAARRYDGSHPDPDNPGHALPRVRYWQAWNEPNLGMYIDPQWTANGSGLAPASPDIYRALLNGWYRGMKSVVPSDVVVTAGTAPFGDPPGGERIPPALFDRSLFCLRGRHSLRRVRCPDAPVHFDVLAHHPYPIGVPRAHAPNPDDVTIADFARLTRPLARALRAGTVAPSGPKQVWATEFSWVTNPPSPTGIAPARAAAYTAGDLSELWSERVSVALWYQLRDRAPSQRSPFDLPLGLYFAGPTIAQDVAKPALSAFAFPFTAHVRRGRARLWGLAPRAGRVIVERSSGGRWRPLRRLRARGNRVFAGSARLRAGSLVRARQGGRTSLPWRAR